MSRGYILCTLRDLLYKKAGPDTPAILVFTNDDCEPKGTEILLGRLHIGNMKGIIKRHRRRKPGAKSGAGESVDMSEAQIQRIVRKRGDELLLMISK